MSREYWSRYDQCKDRRAKARKRTRQELTSDGFRRTEKQADSLFLTKLPSEIRNQIYELCFEHQKMLVVPVKRQSHTKLASFPAQDKHNHHPDDLVACDHLLGLPLTCKQIYAETIDMLYSRTTFCFMQPEQIVPFHKQLLPQRWNAITSIEFDSDLYHRLRKLDMDLPAHSFVHRSEAWLEFWSLVNTMESLERVVITRTKLGFRFENLAAMEQVKKRLEVFDVYLAETQIMCDPVDVDLKTAQFKLFLPSGQQYLADPPLSGPTGNYGGVMERMHQAWWQM
ncbi:hypothetical protein CB0940_07162 [Cercospora beticola]|uniref:DUF7730 domain-containing protein n=1 Tax=Cercospora beticola TaxID=122368 RepID=A0A2G5H9W1_CERBT|nr:hypothetical protein CB0940_07162 [Cercospora beticola]PIA89318.1 hypothetical protein CB0940_07162 [Cercospora beticola]WPB03090.1 hypothetical protein RHO25_007727 [Cercospora beticola]